MAVIRREYQLRINPYNNTFTIGTPCDELYLNLPGLRLNNVDHSVMAYLPAPDNAVRGVIYGALGNETAEEIIQLCILENPNLQILSARRMGLSRAMVITFAGANLPRIVKFQCMPFNCFPFKESIETCYNCRRTGHRADVCYQPPTQRCRRCREVHPPPPQGEAPSCEARCIICDGAHTTGSRNCKQRFVTKPKKALHRSSPLPVTSNRYSALSSDDDQAVDKDFSDKMNRRNPIVITQEPDNDLPAESPAPATPGADPPHSHPLKKARKSATRPVAAAATARANSSRRRPRAQAAAAAPRKRTNR
ncbi:hypothetical protein HPB50_006902 [Hyalomma asiaticum]|uniref:Uncharacterized protein n=1 Tax=Hyalomma asiaticum TaxID=266040 RepID=A0ACB7RN68_HYAAI|nr:hypothetical protein HPB50_006902 [Hyalomma asiaticum]